MSFTCDTSLYRAQIAKAMKRMHQRKNIGKIILSPMKEPEPEPEPAPKEMKAANAQEEEKPAEEGEGKAEEGKAEEEGKSEGEGKAEEGSKPKGEEGKPEGEGKAEEVPAETDTAAAEKVRYLSVSGGNKVVVLLR